jgi:hypothetical protein
MQISILNYNSFISTVTLLAATATAAASPPSQNAYAFNWLQPNSAKCKKLTKADIKKFGNRCAEDSPGFGSHKPTHTCRTGKHSEFIIYKNLKQCQQELEIMQANGP